MSNSAAKSSVYTQLRNEAEARLKLGAAAGNRSLGLDALHMLYGLSSNPKTAADALKLLHELQVHQVELDLQREEMEVNEQRIVAEFAHYKELYEFAPLGYFLIDFQGRIIEANWASAELFGVGRAELTGNHINRFLVAESRSVLANLLERVAQGDGTLVCEVILDGETDTARRRRMVARVSPDKHCVMLACCECK